MKSVVEVTGTLARNWSKLNDPISGISFSLKFLRSELCIGLQVDVSSTPSALLPFALSAGLGAVNGSTRDLSQIYFGRQSGFTMANPFSGRQIVRDADRRPWLDSDYEF